MKTMTTNQPSEESLQLAAQCWCDEETKLKEMDIDLAIAFAKRLDKLQAIIKEKDSLLKDKFCDYTGMRLDEK